MSTWLLDFETVMARHYDTPDEFLQGIGYMIAGASLANRVYLRSPDEVTTNLYLLLCSPPGWYHKSSPLRAGVRVLKSVLPSAEFIPSNASSEALGSLISASMNGTKRGHGVLIYDEFRAFLGHIRKEYAANIGVLVTERFERGMDLQFARRGKPDGSGSGGVNVDTIPGGYILSFTASTTTPWLLESMRGSDVTGGMLSRFLLIEAHEKTRSHELPIPLDPSKLSALGKELERIRSQYELAEFRFKTNAANDYRALYRDIEKGAMSHGHPEYPSLISRAPTYVKKIALLSAAMEERGDNLIYPDDVESAAELVMRSIKSCEGIIDEAVAGEGAYARGLIRAKKVLSTKKRIPKRDLLRTMHMRVRELDEVLESLSQQGLIKHEREGRQEIIVWLG